MVVDVSYLAPANFGVLCHSPAASRINYLVGMLNVGVAAALSTGALVAEMTHAFGPY